MNVHPSTSPQTALSLSNLAGKAEGRGQEAEGILSSVECCDPREQGFKPHSKSPIGCPAIGVSLVAERLPWEKPTPYCDLLPSASCLLPSSPVEKTALKPSMLRQFWTGFLSWKGIRAGLEAGLIRGNEPKICRKCDRDGNEYFQVYDRATDRWHHFNSEAEVRTWLDRRYYD